MLGVDKVQKYGWLQYSNSIHLRTLFRIPCAHVCLLHTSTSKKSEVYISCFCAYFFLCIFALLYHLMQVFQLARSTFCLIESLQQCIKILVCRCSDTDKKEQAANFVMKMIINHMHTHTLTHTQSSIWVIYISCRPLLPLIADTNMYIIQSILPINFSMINNLA